MSLDVEQAVGRILRKKDAEALVIDIIDQHPVFQRQWKKRRAFYRRNKYTIHMADMEQYKQKKWINENSKTKLNNHSFFQQKNPLLIGKCLIMD